MEHGVDFMDIITIMCTYTVGTLFGLVVGARWAYIRGIVFGVSTTIAELESLNIISQDWRERKEIIKKLQEISNNQENQ